VSASWLTKLKCQRTRDAFDCGAERRRISRKAVFPDPNMKKGFALQIARDGPFATGVPVTASLLTAELCVL